MEKRESTLETTVETAERLLKTLSVDSKHDLKLSIEKLRETAARSLNEDPIRTFSLAFSVGFAITRMLQSPKMNLTTMLSGAAQAALVYGVVNPLLKTTENTDPVPSALH